MSSLRKIPFLMLLAASAASCGDSPTAQTPTQEVRVSIGPDVPAAARTEILSIVSSADSVAPDKGVLRARADSAAAPLYALNADGEPVLGAMLFGRTPDAALSVRGTAVMLVQSLLIFPFVGVGDTEARGMAPAIEAHPAFGQLLEAVEGTAAAGASYLDSDAAFEAAAAIALDLAPPPPAEPASLLEAGSLRASIVPVLIEDGGGTSYDVINEAFYPFSVTAYDSVSVQISTAKLPAREIRITSFPWKFGGRQEAVLQGRNGRVLVRVGQNAETRLDNQIQMTSDMMSLIFKSLGVAVYGNTPRGIAMGVLDKVTPQQIQDIASSPLEEAGWMTANLLWDAREDIITAVLQAAGKKMSRTFVTAGLKQALKVWQLSDVAVFLLERSPYYVAWNRYHDKSDAVTVCQEGGIFKSCGITGRYDMVSRIASRPQSRAQGTCSFRYTADVVQNGTRLDVTMAGEPQEGCHWTDLWTTHWWYIDPDNTTATATLSGQRIENWQPSSGVGPYSGQLTPQGFSVSTHYTNDPWDVDLEITATRIGDIPAGAEIRFEGRQGGGLAPMSRAR